MFRVWTGCFGALILMTSLASADVSVKFSNDALAINTTNAPSLITLSFTVDETGHVVLDASAVTAELTVQDAVNAWDGPVGTINYTGAFNTTFTLELRDWGGAFTLNSTEGGGLGITGQDDWRIDRPGFEFIAVTASIKAGTLDFRSVSWTLRSDFNTHMTLTCPAGSLTNSLTAPAGSWDVSGKGVMMGDNQYLKIGNVYPGDDKSGYILAGFSFDVIEAVP